MKQPVLKDTRPCKTCYVPVLPVTDGNTGTQRLLGSAALGVFIVHLMATGWICRIAEDSEREALVAKGHRFYAVHECTATEEDKFKAVKYILTELRRSHMAIEIGNGNSYNIIGAASAIELKSAVRGQQSAILTLAKEQRATPDTFAALRIRYADCAPETRTQAVQFYQRQNRTLLELFLLALPYERK